MKVQIFESKEVSLSPERLDLGTKVTNNQQPPKVNLRHCLSSLSHVSDR